MKLVLIAGAQRSGTTLLQTLLANALGAPVLPESHILCDILTAHKRALQSWNKTRFYYCTEDDLRDFFRAFANRHIEDLARTETSQSTLVLKDPNFVQVLPEAAAIFPECQRIVCVRDPRDIVASFLRIGKREGPEATSRYSRRDIHFIAKKVLASYAPLTGASSPQDVILVRYEKLAAEPKGTLRALAEETGLQISYEKLSNLNWLAPEARHDPTWVSDLEGQNVNPANVGAFRDVMERSEIKIVQKICAGVMADFGYEPISTDPPKPKLPPSLARRILRFVKRRVRGKPRDTVVGVHK
jgi:hypothetical protein